MSGPEATADGAAYEAENVTGSGKTDPMPESLITDTERKAIALEQKWWAYQGAKNQAIRDELGMTPTGYAQFLNAMIDDPRIEAAEPVLVHRLQRRRDKRL